jgi:hypothetical protein
MTFKIRISIKLSNPPPLKKNPGYSPNILLTLNIYNAIFSACCPVVQGDSDKNKVLN